MLNRQPCITDYATEREGIDGVVPWNGDDTRAIRQHDMLSLTRDSEAGLYKGTNHIEMIDARNLWHSYKVSSISRTCSPRSCSSTTAR